MHTLPKFDVSQIPVAYIINYIIKHGKTSVTYRIFLAEHKVLYFAMCIVWPQDPRKIIPVQDWHDVCMISLFTTQQSRNGCLTSAIFIV